MTSHEEYASHIYKDYKGSFEILVLCQIIWAAVAIIDEKINTNTTSPGPVLVNGIVTADCLLFALEAGWSTGLLVLCAEDLGFHELVFLIGVGGLTVSDSRLCILATVILIPAGAV